MIAKIISRLEELNTDFIKTLKMKSYVEDYGIESCTKNDNNSNIKYLKIKKDFLTYYNQFVEYDLRCIKNNCNVLNIINKL